MMPEVNLTGNAVPRKCLVRRVRTFLGGNTRARTDGSADEPQNHDPRHEEAHVMEAVRRLAAGVAHDLNNLLLVVQGYAEMALAEADAGPQTLAHLAEVRDASVRTASLAEDLLTVGQCGRVAPRMLQLNESISRALPTVRAEAADGVEVRLALAPDLPAVFSDDEQIARLVAALCARAWSVMPAGGRLTIGTQAAEPDSSGQRRVLLTFADTGAPVPAELRVRLFEPFLPLKADSKGLGLELSIASSIVHRLGGTIEVESPPQGGTIFAISLPVLTEAPKEYGAPAPPSKETAEISHRSPALPVEPGQTILLAEDDEGLRTLAMKLLAREGYEVLVARDGQEAVELFERNKDAICLALIDDVMPRMGGRAALARMRRILPGLPAVLCTGYTWSLDGKTREYGDILDILPKPWRPRELLRTVREALEPSRSRLPGPVDGP
jgi:two-component system cell cycle sensor histidine kinase/response regulator CckA